MGLIRNAQSGRVSLMATNHALRVAANVRAELARKRVPQSQIARSLHLSRAAVNRRMSGQVAFDITELYAVAEALEITVSDLIGESVAA